MTLHKVLLQLKSRQYKHCMEKTAHIPLYSADIVYLLLIASDWYQAKF